jgi:hypothetical protein
MRTRSKLATLTLSSALAVAGFSGIAGPAHAADTTTTFTLTAAGGLAVSAPASQALGSVATGATSTAAVQLGATTVTDGRGALLGTWTTSVTSTDYKTGGLTADETIAKGNADYWSGPSIAPTSGTGVRVPGQASALLKTALDASKTAFLATGVIGNNVTTWNPTVNVNIPSASVAGSYSGTIAHSVA